MTDFLNTAELAAYLGVSKIKLVSDRARGAGPPFVRFDGRSIRYERAAVDRWVAEHTVQPKASK
jgi:excisionase family DNA binding protein